VVCTLMLALAGPAFGDVLGNPYDGVQTTGAMAQDFVWPGTDHLDIWVVSDFQTTQDYYLHEVWSQGWATNTNGQDGSGAVFDIYDGLPWDGGSIVLSAADGYDHLHAEGKIGADFGGATLPAGDYYIVYQAVHDFLMVAGNTVMYHTSYGDADDMQWNPGLGHNWGSDHRDVTLGDGTPIDVNWQLEATPVPEPAALAMLLASVGVLTRRR
jgi:hypothetical protein